jgi:GNAT superfamily N-acetyltransferase
MATLSKIDDITFRKLGPLDRPAFEEHLLALNPASRRSRFGMSATDSFLSVYAERCITLNAVIRGAMHRGQLVGVAELRPFTALPSQEAEIAFSVSEDWRNFGIGTALFAKTLRSARNRGYTCLLMTCIAQNGPMRSLARKFSAEILVDVDQSIGVVEAMHPTIISLLMEALDDASTLAQMALATCGRLARRKGLKSPRNVA